MRTKDLCSYIVVVLIATTGVAENLPTNLQTSQKLVFFSDTPKNVLRVVARYTRVPEGAKSLPVDQNSNIVVSFKWWLDRLINSSCVPSQEVVVSNILLIPAGNGVSEDVAFMALTIRNKSCLVAQTGGLNGYFYLLADIGEVRTNNTFEVKGTVETFLATTIRPTNQTTSIAMSAITTNGLFVGIGTVGGISLRCVTNGKELYVAIPKSDFQDTIPAREPLPNQWFAWERMKAKTRSKK